MNKRVVLLATKKIMIIKTETHGTSGTWALQIGPFKFYIGLASRGSVPISNLHTRKQLLKTGRAAHGLVDPVKGGLYLAEMCVRLHLRCQAPKCKNIMCVRIWSGRRAIYIEVWGRKAFYCRLEENKATLTNKWHFVLGIRGRGCDDRICEERSAWKEQISF